MITPAPEDLSPHFSSTEMACKDCGRCKVDSELMNALEEYRVIVKLPVRVHCACRCVEHNDEVGGKTHSEHLISDEPPKFCKAADLDVPGMTLQQMFDAALRVAAFRYGGIGVYDGGFLHVDVREIPARWARVAGKYVGIAESKLVKESP